MNKKFIIITIVIMIIFSTFTIYKYTSENSISIGNFTKEGILSKELVDSYLSANKEDQEKIENKIKDISIKEMKHDKWLEYIDYVKLIVYPIDIVGDSEKELIIGLNLSKNLGSLGVYKLEGNKYKLTDQIDNLTTIEKISVERSSTSDKRFLILEEYLDERVGAYFTDEFIRIFTKTDDKFEEVFRESTEYEAYFHEKWLDKEKDKPKWFKLSENNIIAYDSKVEKAPSIRVNKTLKKLEGKNGTNSKVPTEFKENQNENYEEKYIWNELYKKFILSEGEVISTGEKVALLEDMSKNVDYLLNLDDKYYKIVNKNRKIKFIRQDEIRINDL